MEKEANSNQLAVAIAAALTFNQHKRQLYVIPPGMGKSIIITAFATIMMRVLKRVDSIYIAFPD